MYLYVYMPIYNAFLVFLYHIFLLKKLNLLSFGKKIMATLKGNNIEGNTGNTRNTCNVKWILKGRGYIIVSKIADTLQGSVFLGKIMKTNEKIVIKITSVLLHTNHIANVTGKGIVKVYENIENEVAILLYLSTKSPPKGIHICIQKKSKHMFFVCESKYIKQSHL